ncbi:MAG: RagB/SusD family nutrient uptake outer membrane protein [Chitinophagaceae bacterium]|nr:MAG: RagB/SusD family nutrient uptake outer membrane protein [Chitinophagaceae bacterium]
MNTRFALQPGRDVDSVEYTFALGKPFVKFQKYADDLRLKKYRNLGDSKREGMFLYGYLPYTATVNGNPKVDTVRGNKGPYALFIRDQVGFFLNAKPGTKIADKESNMNHADHNSGVFLVKYPFYPTPDPNRITSAYAEIRLTEVYYTLAECRYRTGDKAGAAGYLNQVRGRLSVAMPPYPTAQFPVTTKADVVKAIIHEKTAEMTNEEVRNVDIIRWRRKGYFATEPIPNFASAKELLPIPQSEIDNNPNLGN